MRVLFDTNIFLDLLMDRAPFAEAAVELFSRVEGGTISGYVCSTSITTIYYIASKTIGTVRAQEEVKKLLNLFEVAPVNRAVLEAALAANFVDFEDAVIYEAACHVGAEAIVTRNQKYFRKSKISVYSSAELVNIMR
ncbi:MAG: PIN domain-containing protein [Deltaproteobacteria bacterium]|nr:PIN domain-containing protein [Deltaproteobacteria bacterium]